MRDNKFFYCEKGGLKIELPRTNCIFTDSENYANWCARSGEISYECTWINRIKDNPDNIFDFSKNFVDIGGALGCYTVELGKLFNHVYTFEPNKKSYYLIHANCILNDIVEKVDIYNVFLSDKRKTVNYNGWCSNNLNDIIGIDSDKLTDVCITNFDAEHLDVNNDYKPIQTMTLDDYHLDNVGFIKIDTEGQELEILKGSLATIINNNYPVIEFEFWNPENEQTYHINDKTKYYKRVDDLINFLQNLGYEIIYNVAEESHLAVHRG